MFDFRIVMIGILSVASANLAYAATGYLEPPTPKSNIHLAAARDVVRSESSGNVVRSTSGACVRTRWQTNYDECDTQVVNPPPPPAPVVQKKAMTLSREERTVYFGFNHASLTPQMQQRLDTLANTLKAESRVKGARIVGTADRLGNTKYNEKLSQKRAEVVKKYLGARGLVNTSVAETRWTGENESVTACSEGLERTALIDCLQQDRRVEVEIDYYEVQASR